MHQGASQWPPKKPIAKPLTIFSKACSSVQFRLLCFFQRLTVNHTSEQYQATQTCLQVEEQSPRASQACIKELVTTACTMKFSMPPSKYEERCLLKLYWQLKSIKVENLNCVHGGKSSALHLKNQLSHAKKGEVLAACPEL